MRYSRFTMSILRPQARLQEAAWSEREREHRDLHPPKHTHLAGGGFARGSTGALSPPPPHPPKRVLTERATTLSQIHTPAPIGIQGLPNKDAVGKALVGSCMAHRGSFGRLGKEDVTHKRENNKVYPTLLRGAGTHGARVTEHTRASGCQRKNKTSGRRRTHDQPWPTSPRPGRTHPVQKLPLSTEQTGPRKWCPPWQAGCSTASLQRQRGCANKQDRKVCSPNRASSTRHARHSRGLLQGAHGNDPMEQQGLEEGTGTG
jgi:hypothetical protein